jgi:hypothetical protein
VTLPFEEYTFQMKMRETFKKQKRKKKEKKKERKKQGIRHAGLPLKRKRGNNYWKFESFVQI